MSETQHTPGPWAVVAGSIMVEYGGGFFDLAYVDGTFPNGYLTIAERNANANLMAAAPDLLDVLERINAGEPVCSHASHWRGLVDGWDVHTDLCQAMTAAIAKAKGETDASYLT